MITSQELAAWNAAYQQEYAVRIAKSSFCRSVSSNGIQATSDFIADILTAWDVNEDYLEGNFVRHNGTLYRAKKDTCHVEPSVSVLLNGVVTPNADWKVVYVSQFANSSGSSSSGSSGSGSGY